MVVGSSDVLFMFSVINNNKLW